MSNPSQFTTVPPIPLHPQPPLQESPSINATTTASTSPPTTTTAPTFRWPADLENDERFGLMRARLTPQDPNLIDKIKAIRFILAQYPLRPDQTAQEWYDDCMLNLNQRRQQHQQRLQQQTIEQQQALQQQQQQQQLPPTQHPQFEPPESQPIVATPPIPHPPSIKLTLERPSTAPIPNLPETAPPAAASPATAGTSRPSASPPRQAPFAPLPEPSTRVIARPHQAKQRRSASSSRAPQQQQQRSTKWFRTAISEPTTFQARPLGHLRSDDYDDILDPKVLGLSRKEILDFKERFPVLLKDVKMPLASSQPREVKPTMTAPPSKSSSGFPLPRDASKSDLKPIAHPPSPAIDLADVKPIFDLVTTGMLNNTLAVGDKQPIRRLLALITPHKTLPPVDESSLERYARPHYTLQPARWQELVEKLDHSAPTRYLHDLGKSDDAMKTMAFYFDRASPGFPDDDDLALSWIKAMNATIKLLEKTNPDPALVRKYSLFKRMKKGMEATFKQVGRMEGQKRTAIAFRKATIDFKDKVTEAENSQAASTMATKAPSSAKEAANPVDSGAVRRRAADDDAAGTAGESPRRPTRSVADGGRPSAKRPRTEPAPAPVVRRVVAQPPQRRGDPTLFSAARAPDALASMLGSSSRSGGAASYSLPPTISTSSSRPMSSDRRPTPPTAMGKNGKPKKSVRWRDDNLTEVRIFESIREDMTAAPRHSGDFEREGEMLKHRLADQAWYEPEALLLAPESQVQADRSEDEAESARRSTVPAYEMQDEEGPSSPDETEAIVVHPQPGINQWYTPIAPAEVPGAFPELITPTTSIPGVGPSNDLSALLAGLQGVLQNSAAPTQQPPPPINDLSSVLANLSSLQQPQHSGSPNPYHGHVADYQQGALQQQQSMYPQQSYYSPDSTPTNAGFPSSSSYANGRPARRLKTKICKFATDDRRRVICRELKAGVECTYVHPELGEVLR